MRPVRTGSAHRGRPDSPLPAHRRRPDRPARRHHCGRQRARPPDRPRAVRRRSASSSRAPATARSTCSTRRGPRPPSSSAGVPTAWPQRCGPRRTTRACSADPEHEGVLRLGDLHGAPGLRAASRAGTRRWGRSSGAAVRVGPRVFGQLYLSEKAGGFTRRTRTSSWRWPAPPASPSRTRSSTPRPSGASTGCAPARTSPRCCCEDIDEEEALEHIAATAREVARADTAALALPGVGGELVLELAVGTARRAPRRADAARRAGARRSWPTGQGMLATRPHRGPPVRRPRHAAFGPALYAPLQSAGGRRRRAHPAAAGRRPPFDGSDLATAESFAAQAALAYVLAAARQAQDVAALLDERERIARDLHDLAIQQLFATGMQLETVRRRAGAGCDPASWPASSTRPSTTWTVRPGDPARSCTRCATRTRRTASSSACGGRRRWRAPAWGSRRRWS